MPLGILGILGFSHQKNLVSTPTAANYIVCLWYHLQSTERGQLAGFEAPDMVGQSNEAANHSTASKGGMHGSQRCVVHLVLHKGGIPSLTARGVLAPDRRPQGRRWP